MAAFQGGDQQSSNGSDLSTDSASITLLTNQLETVADWYDLGIKLGIPPHILSIIEENHRGVKRRKNEMLIKWLQRGHRCSWTAVIDALRQMEMRTLAQHIENQYYVPASADSGISQDLVVTADITRKNETTMKQKFSILLKLTRKRLQQKLQAREFDIEDFHLTLATHFAPGDCIPSSSDLNEVFLAVTKHQLWDYLNYYPLESIIEEYGLYGRADSEMTRKVDEYKHDLAGFKATTKIVQWMQRHNEKDDSDSELTAPAAKRIKLARNDSRYFERLEMKLEEKFNEHSLMYVEYLWKSIEAHCRLPPHTVLLDKIHKGCVSISWLIQPHVVPQLTETLKRQECAEFFKKHHITRVDIDGECIYEQELELASASTMFQKSEQETSVHQTAEAGSIQGLLDTKMLSKTGESVRRSQQKELSQTVGKAKLLEKGMPTHVKKHNLQPVMVNVLKPVDFWWDRFLAYLNIAIFLLAMITLSMGIFNSKHSTPFHTPYMHNVHEKTSARACDINSNLTATSISLIEQFLYVLLYIILLMVPHYMWRIMFGGEIRGFLAVVKKITWLRNGKTGDYETKNLDLVMKLELEYEGKNIVWFYISKLFLQLFVCFGSMILFSLAYQPSSNNDYFASEYLNGTAPNIRTPNTVSLVQYAEWNLNLLVIVLIIYGIVWCFVRHTTTLGHKKIAQYMFQSGLGADTFAFPPVIETGWLCHQRISCRRKWLHFFRHIQFCFNISNLFTPRIKNDLDFLLVQLFYIDASLGKVIKECQIERELNRLVENDHQLLYLCLNAQQNARLLQSRGPQQLKDLCDYFEDVCFTDSPESHIFSDFHPYLGNLNWKPMKGIRDFMYGFVRFAPKRDLALSVTHGYCGYSLVLSRPFRKAVSFSFLPFYHNEQEVCDMEEYPTNYATVKFPADIFTQDSASVGKANERLFDYLSNLKKRGTTIDFILVGPISDEFEKVSTTLLLDMMYTAELIGEGALLLTICPLKTANKNAHFCKYEPPKCIFDHQHPDNEVQKKLEEEVGFEYVDGVAGVKIVCAETVCIFAFHAYKFKPIKV